MSDFTARSKIMSPTAETVIVAGPEGCVGSNEGVGVADGVGTAVVVTEGLDEAVCVGCAAEARSARTPTATATTAKAAAAAPTAQRRSNRSSASRRARRAAILSVSIPEHDPREAIRTWTGAVRATSIRH